VRLNFGRSAEYKSAKQQITNLRYEAALVDAGPTLRSFLQFFQQFIQAAFDGLDLDSASALRAETFRRRFAGAFQLRRLGHCDQRRNR